jgi:hypothetical protein
MAGICRRCPRRAPKHPPVSAIGQQLGRFAHGSLEHLPFDSTHFLREVFFVVGDSTPPLKSSGIATCDLTSSLSSNHEATRSLDALLVVYAMSPPFHCILGTIGTAGRMGCGVKAEAKSRQQACSSGRALRF